MGKRADNDSNDTSSHCFCKISLLSVAAIVVPFVIFLHFGFSPFLVTVSVLSLSTIFLLTVSKRKPGFVKNTPENQQVEKKVNPETDAVTLSNTPQQSEARDFHDYQVESTDCPSASESSDDLSESEGFELNWDSFNNLGKNVTVSEMLVSSSDEDDEDEDDNLIEISFPDNSISLGEADMDFGVNEKTGAKMQMEFPQYLPESMFRESMFRHEGFMELLKEINEATEEENLIEIDLSMGSIKGQ